MFTTTKCHPSRFQVYLLGISIHKVKIINKRQFNHHLAFDHFLSFINCERSTDTHTHTSAKEMLTVLPSVPGEILRFSGCFSDFLPPSPQHILHATHSFCKPKNRTFNLLSPIKIWLSTTTQTYLNQLRQSS